MSTHALKLGAICNSLGVEPTVDTSAEVLAASTAVSNIWTKQGHVIDSLCGMGITTSVCQSDMRKELVTLPSLKKVLINLGEALGSSGDSFLGGSTPNFTDISTLVMLYEALHLLVLAPMDDEEIQKNWAVIQRWFQASMELPQYAILNPDTLESKSEKCIKECYRAIDLNKGKKKEMSQREKEKKAKEKAAAAAEKKAEEEKVETLEFKLGASIAADAPKDDRLAAVLNALDGLKISHETVHHPKLATCDVMVDHLTNVAKVDGGFCKNIFLKAKKPSASRKNDSCLWLVTTLVHTNVDLKKLTKHLGYPSKGELRMGKDVTGCLGVVPGEVTPFALLNDPTAKVNVVLDQAMMSMPYVWCHPLTNEASTKITPAGLLEYIKASGRVAVIVDFTAI